MNGKREALKTSDIATLGSLCVDVVLDVPELPLLNNTEERKAYTEQLDASSPDKKFWEAGGNCNLVIAASRLGLRVNAAGHVGNDNFGHFLLDVLKDEGINFIGTNENSEDEIKGTTICWVLVDPFQNHDFFCRSDYNVEPSLNWVTKLPESVKMAIEQSKILFCDGYVFDEHRADLITSTLHCAIDAETTIFFDPGPNITSIFNGSQEKRKLLELFLNLSDVLLATSDEIESLTGTKDSIQAGQELINKGNRMKWVVIKMGSQGSVLVTRSSIYCAPVFKVDVVDTVGCGDSYTAAIAFGYVHKLPLMNTITLANAVGAATAMGNGAGRNVATLDKVLELLAQSDIVENHEFWKSLFGENLEVVNEVLLLCRTYQNGCSDRFVHVPVKGVASELIDILNLEKDE